MTVDDTNVAETLAKFPNETSAAPNVESKLFPSTDTRVPPEVGPLSTSRPVIFTPAL